MVCLKKDKKEASVAVWIWQIEPCCKSGGDESEEVGKGSSYTVLKECFG